MTRSEGEELHALETLRMRAVNELVDDQAHVAFGLYAEAHDIAARAHAWEDAAEIAEAMVEIAQKQSRRRAPQAVLNRAPQSDDAVRELAEWRRLERVWGLTAESYRRTIATRDGDLGERSARPVRPSTGPTSASRAVPPPSDLGRSA
jgi:hypothetical protein